MKVTPRNKVPKVPTPTRRGPGRVKGGKNKATIERELLAAEIAKRQMSRAIDQGRELAVEKIEKYMNLFEGAAAIFKPEPSDADLKMDGSSKTPAEKVNPRGDWDKFGEWLDRALLAASTLAKYQSPQLRAIAIAPIPKIEEGERRKRFTLTVFEGGRALPAEGINGGGRREDGGNGAA